MIGNVWEWVADRYDSEYYQNSPYDNPTGPISGSERVLRGGSWGEFDEEHFFVTFRRDQSPDFYNPEYNVFGFRCAASAP
jgi:formylglycine-generating enzyme required for sulfatase activity